MCSVFFISAFVMDFIHGQVAAELQVWNAIVSLNEVAEERLGGCSKEEGRVRASNFSSVYQPTRCSNKCLMIGTECIFCIVGVKGFRGWQSFSTGQQGFGRHLGFLALIDCSFLWCFQHTFVCLKCEKEVGLKLWSEATADSRDSVAGCSASQRVSSLIRSSQRDRPPSFDKWVVVRSYRFRSWVIASEPRTLS